MIREWGRNRARPHSCVFSLPQQRQASGQPVHLMPGFFQSYGITDVATIRDIYELIVADPATYLKYYIGYAEFLDLKRDAVSLWGEAFSQKRFHQEILELGPTSFDLIREYML